VVLAKNRKEWLFAGTMTAGRAGRFYPRAEVLEVLNGTPFGGRASMVEIPAAGAEGQAEYALVVFAAGVEQSERANIAALLRSSIERAMGKEFVPDHITVLPLCPRKGEDGAMDHAWCHEQYLRGALFCKARDPLYLKLSRLRSCL
jgi:hypothetical protein